MSDLGRHRVDPNALAVATDEQIDAVFRESTTLPIERLVNTGAHRVDLASRTIFNDEHWKGYLPADLQAGDLMARLRTGYAKRFWKKGNRYLGETRYVQGNVLVKHSLEEIALDETVNDLAPGRYVILHYTDLVFRNVFYDAMRIVDDDAIVYRGYAGAYPHGRRGFSGVLMRGYTFAQMGLTDHRVLSDAASPPMPDALGGSWRLKAIDTSDHLSDLADVSFDRTAEGHLTSRCVVNADGHSMLVPQFVIDRFASPDAASLPGELRSIDDRLMLGTWTTPITGTYARLLLTGSRGLFHASREKGRGRQFTMHYALTRG